MRFAAVLIAGVVALSLMSPALAQELPKAEKHDEGATYYSVWYTKFKPGKGEEARSIIYEHFWPTDKDIGRAVIPFDIMTGEWDHVVFFPLADGPGELAWKTSPVEERWNAALAERVGGADKVEEIFARFSELIADSKSEIAMTTWQAAETD